MFQAWRWKLREAEEAFKQGRLDEASRLLASENLREFLPGQRLAAKIAEQMSSLARRTASEGDFAAAWRWFEKARAVTGETGELMALHRDFVEMAQVKAEQLLQQGKAAAARELAGSLIRHNAADPRGREIEEVARRIQAAAHLAVKGRFSDAIGQVAAARSLRPELDALEILEGQYQSKQEECGRLVEKLHQAISGESWSDVLPTADRVLALAPEHDLAREAQRRAWATAGTGTGDAAMMPERRFPRIAVRPLPDQQNCPPKTAEERFMIWVDAVGGYLVCLSKDVTIGQAVPGATVDIPIQADISRLHATVRRAGEGYLLQAHSMAWVNGRAVNGNSLLNDGDEIQLGESVRLKFRKPHPLSASARLEIVSRHRMLPNTDGVLLMAESCVLGPNSNNHVECRPWTHDVVLYRQDDKLYCRAMESIEIDGQWCEGRAPVGRNSRIVGGDFSLSLEAVG